MSAERPEQRPQSQPTDGPADAVLAANAELYAAFEAGDLDRMAALWDVRDVSCVHPGWPVVRGRGRVLRSWAVIMANTAFAQFVLTDVRVSRDGDVAVVTCEENLLTGAEEIGTTGRSTATNVFRRRDGAWRLWSHHASPVLAGDRPDQAGG